MGSGGRENEGAFIENEAARRKEILRSGAMETGSGGAVGLAAGRWLRLADHLHLARR